MLSKAVRVQNKSLINAAVVSSSLLFYILPIRSQRSLTWISSDTYSREKISQASAAAATILPFSIKH